MPTSEHRGVELYHESRGHGDPLVLIPGFASGAWSWSWQADEFAENFRTITFDPRGIERSVISGGETVSIGMIVEDIAAMLDELEIASAHVLGISFGGFVAQKLALRYPSRVNKLVLASTSFGGPNHVAPSMQVLAAFSSTEGLNSVERIRKYMAVAFTPEFAEAHAETVERFCQLRNENVVPREVYMQQLQAALSFNVEDDVSRIEHETLVITGDEDVVVPPQNSRNLADAIPRARLAVIQGTGHMAFVEKADEFNRLVMDFLGSTRD